MVLYRPSRGLPSFQKAGAILFCTVVFLWVAITLRNKDATSISGSLRRKQKENYAFATILTGEGDVEFPDVEKPYLQAARLLTFQLLHSPRTRNDSSNIPFLVLVTQDVPQQHREILSKDGAIIVSVESLGRDWIHPKWSRWKDVLAKLNLWQLTDYDNIMFLDADSIIFHSIHDIFSHPATEIRQTLSPQAGALVNHSVPASYMIAGIHDPWVEQFLPPVPGNEFYQKNNYMNAGFFVLHPSKDLFDYYSALLDTPDAFDSAYPEQNLLNCAHKTNGRMPWQDLGSWWNLKGADKSEYERGLKSIHHKWWRPISDEFVGDRIADALEEMENYFRGKNAQYS